MSETNINASIPVQELKIRGFFYSTLISKHDHLNLQSYGLGPYVEDRFPCGMDAKKEDHDFLYMCFRVAHPLYYIRLSSERIDNILIEFRSVKFHICNDFRIRHEK